MSSQRYLVRTGIIAAAALSLIVSACSGSNGDGARTQPNATAAPAADGGEFTIYNCEPRSLNPGDSVAVCGSRVLGQLFSGLTTTDPASGEVKPMVATEWNTEDAKTWTFKLRDDFTFHNGEPVTAHSFIDAWNFIVNPDNAQGSAGFFSNISGYQDVVDGTADTMSGLRAPDATTLEIELESPFSPLPSLLSTTEFYPLPTVAFDDIKAFQESPIGNGRYKMNGKWEHDVQIEMVRNEDWPGENPGRADKITWKIYNDLNTAYLDVQAGELDILSGVAPERVASASIDFPNGSQQDVSSSYSYIGLPLYVEGLDDVRVRHALSMAIDRQSIVDTIFNGAYTPATSLMPPMLPEARSDACTYCTFNPTAAAELYKEANGPSEITIWTNSGGGHEEWIQAVANMWQENLGVSGVKFEALEFAQYLDKLLASDVTGPYRLGWTSSYPSPQQSLETLYTTGVQSNLMHYSSKEFDSLIREANAETDPESATKLYQQAEDVVIEDLPVIPLWFEVTTTVHTDRVANVTVDPATHVRVEAVTVNES